MSLRLALFEPDIPQNAGAILRLAANLALPVDIIDPCGFVWDDRRLRRAGLDYRELAQVARHTSWDSFLAKARADGRRLVLLTTKATTGHLDVGYDGRDTLLLGRESAGVPDAVHDAADLAVKVPIAGRSLNVVTAAAIVLGEALRQTAGFPRMDGEDA